MTEKHFSCFFHQSNGRIGAANASQHLHGNRLSKTNSADSSSARFRSSYRIIHSTSIFFGTKHSPEDIPFHVIFFSSAIDVREIKKSWTHIFGFVARLRHSLKKLCFQFSWPLTSCNVYFLWKKFLQKIKKSCDAFDGRTQAKQTFKHFMQLFVRFLSIWFYRCDRTGTRLSKAILKLNIGMNNNSDSF